MKLIKLWVNNYKNLSNAELQFSKNQLPIALIGNNGTGKSNIIEALTHIFMGLYYGDNQEFDYQIEYLANNQQVFIKNNNNTGVEIFVDNIKWSQNKFKSKIRRSLDAPFPSLVFSYYSGSCKRLEKQLNRYEKSYSAKLRQQDHDLNRQFVFTTIIHAEWIFLALLCHQKNQILPEISLASRDTIKFILTPPKDYDPEVHDPTCWSSSGAIRDFLLALDRYSRESNDTRKPINDGEITTSRTYYIEAEDLYSLGSHLTRRETNLYSIILALSANKILKKVSFEIESQGNQFSFDFLSEGEKQILAVIGGATLTDQNESILLLDEPDTHLNPEWTWKYCPLLRQALTGNQSESSSILLATHDPILISGLSKEQVIISHKNGSGGISFAQPLRDPKGQGIANILTSEFFGLPSSLDIDTQKLMDRRLELSFKTTRLTDSERTQLKSINEELEILGLGISERDSDYIKFLEKKYGSNMQA
ncbi:AAA family ATPase [Microbulbifer sp. SSSA008]|uniref:AAA family ATPase n=1 Tax=Microbulbifer sp. SSSA008 TaxID=3243380 RepID=UPI004039224F